MGFGTRLCVNAKGGNMLHFMQMWYGPWASGKLPGRPAALFWRACYRDILQKSSKTLRPLQCHLQRVASPNLEFLSMIKIYIVTVATCTKELERCQQLLLTESWKNEKTNAKAWNWILNILCNGLVGPVPPLIKKSSPAKLSCSLRFSGSVRVILAG